MIGFILSITGQECFEKNTDIEDKNKRENEFNMLHSGAIKKVSI